MHYKYLNRYAEFLLTHHLDEFTRLNISKAKEKDLHILKALSILSDKELFVTIRENVSRFLQALSNNSGLESIDQTYRKWKTGVLPHIKSKDVISSDVIEVNDIRKKLFIHFLYQYTENLKEHQLILTELEDFYTEVYKIALNAFIEVEEEKLSAEKVLNKTVLDSALHAIVALKAIRDKSGTITDFEYTLLNKEAERMMGRRKESIIGKTLKIEFPATVTEGIFSKYIQCVEIGQKFDLEFYYPHEGFHHWFRQTINKWHDGIVVVTIDITQDKSKEEELNKTFEKLQEAYQELLNTQAKLKDSYTVLESKVRERTAELEAVNHLNTLIAEETDLHKVVQAVTDVSTQISGAEFGAFFYTLKDEQGESYTLYTISGVAKENFSKFPMPRNTKIFASTFTHKKTSRSDDITKHPDYGKNKPYHGMPDGHLPVKSYLSVPVISKEGDILGGLFFGNSKPGVFTEKTEKVVEAIASQAAIAIDNLTLFEAQRSSELLLKEITNATPVTLWMSDEHGKITFVNQTWTEWTGMNFEQTLGAGWLEAIHSEDQDYVKSTFRKSLENKEDFNLEFRILNKNRQIRWCRGSGVPRYRLTKQFAGFVGSWVDFTERKMVEQALEYQSMLNKTTTDNATSALFMMDANGYCTLMNPAAEKMLGFTFEEISTKPLHYIVHHHRPDGTLYPIEECPLDRALPENFDVRAHEDVFIRKDGTYFPVVCAASPIYENGRPVSTVIEVRDITEEKRMIQTLHENESQLRLITDNIPAYIAYIDKYQCYRFANNSYSKINDNYKSMIGKTMETVLGKESYENSLPKFIECLKGKTVSFNNTIQLKDGSIQEVEAKYVPDFAPDGSIRGVVVMAIDQTERLKYERDLAGKNKQLQRINNDLDNFVYTASHDLKAPVSNIEGLVTTIKDLVNTDFKKDELVSILNLIDLSVHRFKNTILDLTEISKIQRVQENYNDEIILEDIIDDLKVSIADMIVSSSVTIKSDFTECPTILFSKTHIKSIFYNLISNSIKYRSPERLPVIHIRCKSDSQYHILEFTDNGLGISASNQAKVFTMFKRFHTHVEGTGIGLYIVKRILQNSGGKIELESEEGVGSTFRVFIKKT